MQIPASYMYSVVSERNCLPNNKVEAPIPSSMTSCGYLLPFDMGWRQRRESRQRCFRRACHVSRGAAPCWDDHQRGTTFIVAKIRTFLFLRNTLSLSLLALCKLRLGRASLAPLSFTYGVDTGLSASTAPRRVPAPAPVNHPPFFGPSPLVPDDALSSAACVARCGFGGQVPRGLTFLLPASKQFHLSDHPRARPSFRCQQPLSP